MKKFKYRLEALLKVKEHIEKEKQKEHALSVQRVLNQEKSISEIVNHKNSTIKNQTTKQGASFSVAEMLVYGRYLMKLKRDKYVGHEMLNALKKKETDKRQELLVASKEKKIQEKLKDKMHDKYNDNVKTLESKEADEIAGNCYRLNKFRR